MISFLIKISGSLLNKLPGIFHIPKERGAAILMHGLMIRLFRQDARYIVQGGDWGAQIANWLAYMQPTALMGIHLNMVSVYAQDAVPETVVEKDLINRRALILDWETGYNHEQETRPQTLCVAMVDSPVGVAAWMLEKFGQWAMLTRRADGSPDIWSKFTEEQLLNNIMLYIAPASVVTATWIYHGKRLEGSDHFPAGTHIGVPTGVAAFPDPVFLPTPRSFAEKTYNIVHWSNIPPGGHFAAMEEPELFLADLKKIHCFSIRAPGNEDKDPRDRLKADRRNEALRYKPDEICF